MRLPTSPTIKHQSRFTWHQNTRTASVPIAPWEITRVKSLSASSLGISAPDLPAPPEATIQTKQAEQETCERSRPQAWLSALCNPREQKCDSRKDTVWEVSGQPRVHVNTKRHRQANKARGCSICCKSSKWKRFQQEDNFPKCDAVTVLFRLSKRVHRWLFFPVVHSLFIL